MSQPSQGGGGGGGGQEPQPPPRTLFVGNLDRKMTVTRHVEARVMGERVDGEREPKTAKVIAACVRTILEGVDDALVPALSTLASDYLGGTKATDHFFRSMASLGT